MPLKEELPAQRYRDLADQELVERCVAGDRMAWNEFFRRFTPLIRRTIHKVIQRSGYVGVTYQSKGRLDINTFSQHEQKERPDPVDHSQEYTLVSNEAEEEIYCNVVIKLYNGGLSLCKNYKDVHPWLIVVAGNKALDWLKGRLTIDNRPEFEAEKSIRSLDEPLGDEGEDLLEAVLAPPDDDCSDLKIAEGTRNIKQETLRSVLKELLVLKNRKAYWILRLSILGEELLDEEEILALSAQIKRPVMETMEKIQSVWERVYEKKKKLERRLERGAALTTLLHSQENDLFHARISEPEDRIRELQEKCARTRELRDKCLKESQIECRPSNREIVELLELADKEEKDISVILLRTRKRLKDLSKQEGYTSRGM